MSWPFFMNPVVALSGALGLLVLVAIGVGAIVRRANAQREAAILQYLSAHSDAWSFDIREALGYGAGPFYSSLYALEASGRIASRWSDERTTAGYRKRVYWLTR